jgi:hypothetical protein
MKTKHQIIDETVAYYSEDTKRRAVTGQSCHYFQKETGNMCAVGRCANDPQKLDGSCYFKTLSAKLSDEEIFKPEYRGHSVEFWSDLQFLHDENSHWDEKGLTPEGKEYVKNLKENYHD